MKVVLAEKPSVARDIAKHLRANTRNDGYFSGDEWVVTWAFGHMVELKTPDEYNPAFKRWSLDALPILPEQFELKARAEDSVRKQLDTVKALFERANEIVCATDAGREGELIFRYILSWSQCEQKQFRRLWISSLTPEAIRDGFNNLMDGHSFDPLHEAARCRSEADWIVGMNGTRFYTVEYGGEKTLWSVGRVQTPVLALIVNRDLEIENFKPEDYWEVHTKYRDTVFKHEKGKIKKREIADGILSKITDQDFFITDLAEKKENVNPPLLYDLTELQKEMNRRFGMTADDTLKAAQSLYEKKHITYPRTDSRYLSKDLIPKIPPLLQALTPIKEEAIAELDLTKLSFGKRIVSDAKVTDHHAIIPTNILPGQLPVDENRVYEAVVTRFIAVFYPPCIKGVTIVKGKAAEEKFKAKGTVIIDPGWQVLYPHLLSDKKEKSADKKNGKTSKTHPSPNEPQVMPRFAIGESGAHKPEIKTLKTSPPKHFNEASLLHMMETAGRMVEEEELKQALKEKGIGTPATRASIIEVLLQRKYIERRKKNLLSTTSGRQLISLIHDERLKSPELTGEWEALLKQIENGTYQPNAFMEKVIAHTREIITATKANVIAKAGLGNCPACKSPIIQGKRGYGCSRWKEGCKFVLWKTTFGTEIDPALASEIFHYGKTLEPRLLEKDGKKCFGRIVLREGGELSCETIEANNNGSIKGALGKCPTCGGKVVESPKAYGCSNWKMGCKFTIWKKIAGKNITKTIAKQLLKDKKSKPITGFTSKAGKPFDASLQIVGDQVKFAFDNNPEHE